MLTEYKLYYKAHTPEEFQRFIDLCEASQCYPWSITTLQTNLDRQQRWPNRTRGYTPSGRYYDCSWTYTDKDKQEVERWLTWMALKYTVALERTTLLIDEQTNEVITRT